jgi:hypothetical protein
MGRVQIGSCARVPGWQSLFLSFSLSFLPCPSFIFHSLSIYPEALCYHAVAGLADAATQRRRTPYHARPCPGVALVSHTHHLAPHTLPCCLPTRRDGLAFSQIHNLDPTWPLLVINQHRRAESLVETTRAQIRCSKCS